ncbi:uncharacterized protein LOC111325490 isoform X1 [Stylophora pistillata]|uniref:uncharacterized protein LOC111325490 isoform X1 n=1 Tax=Stylophora pistillata TaxID=50429 RepID=UPI000C04C6C8|nr:uncharacterized protein LOC111325490 isoform X1 [Stylophora pistillata]
MAATKMVDVKTIFFLLLFLTMACQGLMNIPVRIGQRASLQVPLTQLENGTGIGWFYCPTKNCYPHWNKHFLAEIIFQRKARVDDPNFDSYLNGTLVIKNVPPSYDGSYFMARVHLNGTGKTYTYHLKITKGSPKLTFVSPKDIYVYVGMDLYLEAEVEGYPYPWVSLSHDQHVLQNRSNFRSSKILRKVNSNITKADGGLYIICAGNAYGNHCLIMRVHVQNIPIPTLPPSSGDVTFPRSDAPGSSKSPPPGMYAFCLGFL